MGANGREIGLGRIPAGWSLVIEVDFAVVEVLERILADLLPDGADDVVG